MCGGTAEKDYYKKLNEGLSPRVRGNLEQQRIPDLVIRSIPACAGEPPPAPCCR